MKSFFFIRPSCRSAVASCCLVFGMAMSSFSSALTPVDLQKWMAVTPRVQQWMMEHHPELDPFRVTAEPGSSFSEVVNDGLDAVARAGLSADLGNLLSDSGYLSVQQWAEDHNAVVQALVAIRISDTGLDQMQIDAMTERLERMTKLSEEERAAFTRMIERAQYLMNETSQIPEEDIALIRANQADIQKIIR